MNILRLCVTFALLETTFGQLLQFCGPEDCRISSLISCENLVKNYDFQGSCCSLKSVVATNGCLIIVGGNNNCGWSPKCGPCDTANSGACMEYESAGKDIGKECPVIDKFDVLGQATAAPKEAPGPGETSAPTPLFAPSSFPSVTTTCPPTPSPTTTEEFVPPDSAEIVVQGSKVMILGALATFFLF
jgi:hypothetical protein